MQSVLSLSWLEWREWREWREWQEIWLGSLTHYLLLHHHPVRLDKSVFRGMLGTVLGKDPMTLPKRNQQ